jgi:hypothetical protein
MVYVVVYVVVRIDELFRVERLKEEDELLGCFDDDLNICWLLFNTY